MVYTVYRHITPPQTYLFNNRADSPQHSLYSSSRIESMGIVKHFPGIEQTGNAISMLSLFPFWLSSSEHSYRTLCPALCRLPLSFFQESGKLLCCHNMPCVMLGPLSSLLSLCKHTYIKHDLLLQFLTFIQQGFGGRQHQSHEKQSGAAAKCNSASDPRSEGGRKRQ